MDVYSLVTNQTCCFILFETIHTQNVQLIWLEDAYLQIKCEAPKKHAMVINVYSPFCRIFFFRYLRLKVRPPMHSDNERLIQIVLFFRYHWNWSISLKLVDFIEIGRFHWNWSISLKLVDFIEIGRFHWNWLWQCKVRVGKWSHARICVRFIWSVLLSLVFLACTFLKSCFFYCTLPNAKSISS